jgi:hypothetical protein
MSSSPANVIICVTGAATASEMKAVTTGRTVILMSDRPVVTFPGGRVHWPLPGSTYQATQRVQPRDLR